MRITVLVFSQTGNTLRVAEAMADTLEARGHDVLLLRTSLFEPDETELSESDLLIVGSPTFFSRGPLVVLEYLSALPALGGLPVAVFVTSGGASGRTLWELGRSLDRHGARVLGGTVFPGEVSFPARSLRGCRRGLPGPVELERAARFAVAAAAAAPGTAPGAGAAHSALGGSGPTPLRLTSRGRRGYYGLLGLLLGPAVVRRVLRPPTVDATVCNRCGWCVGACPVGAIVLEPSDERHPRPVRGGQGGPAPEIVPEVCIRCYRCLECPIDAYSLSWHIGVESLIGLLYHRRLVDRFGDPEVRRASGVAG